ncbi:MAPEG family protein [Halocynthiibacter sp. C4]|uniref:MAPEG family protein n=1 Tax=Halocynthiibacter sp. C4 TaxID=2992758 RepID=UPI00237AC0AB|nr:MAPEG family protein [Halocynthiibacter sp. C4]MDE0588524.1 MAPEG family protein [Halocynthiibacter sp. C4]
MTAVSDYSTAIISLLVFVLIVLFQAALVGAGKAKQGLTPGSMPSEDYENGLYRLNRSHQNGVENMAAAAIALFTCILVGVSAWWVNLLMLLFLIDRILYVLVYARSIGNPTQGVRTFVYVFGWGVLVVMCVMAGWAVL